MCSITVPLTAFANGRKGLLGKEHRYGSKKLPNVPKLA